MNPYNEKKKTRRRWIALAACAVILFSGCVAATPYPAPRAGRTDNSYGAERRRAPGEGWETERLHRVITPLIRAMDRPCATNEVGIELLRENEINAANAGGCRFYVTTGLLQEGSDDHLRGVMAHEIAHQDLGHVMKAQALGAGIGVGVALLEQLLPGSGALTPLAGTLLARSYGRSEEYAADRHALEILRRAGYSPAIMIDTLNWLRRSDRDHGGGFLSTHPALADRIAELRRLS